ncbi:alpha-L-fucosidase [candidate division KSB1 bacterium]|nr:alpha-L-fucosidase [candidate division KSB1 bacterium]
MKGETMFNAPIFFEVLLGLFLSGLVTNLLAQEQEYFPDPDPSVQQKLEAWQDLKFGLLMHWGPYSQWGIVESWSICAEDEPWCRRKIENYEAYKQQYERLPMTFNPLHFQPEKWAQAAKYAGMKYVVFTTKHHDGFCMFDTRATNYKITDPACPFSTQPRANITKEIFNAFRAENFWVGAYFSKPDWHSAYYWWPNFATPDRNVNYDLRQYPDRWQKFIDFTHQQILELMTEYGKVDILWLDGGWVQPLTPAEIQTAINRPDYKFMRLQSQDIQLPELVRKARTHQPGLIVVDRAVRGPYQNYLTPENQVPEKMLPYPWESCIIAGGGWSYVPDADYKTPGELIHLLVDIVAKGGNLLLNIAPAPDGAWPAAAYDRLQKIGDWMQVNQEAIYATRPIAPYKEGKVALTRHPHGSVYAIYLAAPGEMSPPNKIWLTTLQPAPQAQVTLLGTNQSLKFEKVGQGFLVEIPPSIQQHPPCEYAWTMKISAIQE